MPEKNARIDNMKEHIKTITFLKVELTKNDIKTYDDSVPSILFRLLDLSSVKSEGVFIPKYMEDKLVIIQEYAYLILHFLLKVVNLR